MSNVYEQIEKVIPTLNGWCSLQKAHLLAASVFVLRPEISVVIGVWGGRDLFSLAMACKEIGFGKVIGIDPWNSSASVQDQRGSNFDWWSKVDHEEVYKQFLKDRKVLGLEHWTVIERMISDYYDPKNAIGVLVIDGNHGEAAIRDVNRFAPQVKPGGFVFLDDLQWDMGAVGKAAQRLLDLGFKQVWHFKTNEEDWATFQKVT